MDYLTVDADKCTHDFLCTLDCPQRILKVDPENGLPYMLEIGAKLCLQCGHCVAICPSGALSLKNMTAAECEIVQRNNLPDAQSVAHLLKSRRTVRIFKESEVDRADINRLLDIASYAPTGHNRQNVQWMVYEGRDKIHRLSGLVADWMKKSISENPALAKAMHLDLVLAARKRGWDNIMRDAPNLVIACSPTDEPSGNISCIIALTYLEIAAYASGIGACWAGFFTAAANHYQPLQEELGLNRIRVHGAMLLGYPRYRYLRVPLRKQPVIEYK
jgi:nitroreductase/NAD-dependent dihydropyrimidine dehydrogenase PreA subunit